MVAQSEHVGRTSTDVEVHKGHLLLLVRVSLNLGREPAEDTRLVNTRQRQCEFGYTFTEAIARSPDGWALKRKEESAIAPRRHIVTVDRKAETLFTREMILCMMGRRRPRMF